jgi:hypothetical protein
MFFGIIAHSEVRSNVEIINVFRADRMPQIHDIMFVVFLVEIGLIVKTVL